MKLLFDENLSPRLVTSLSEHFAEAALSTQREQIEAFSRDPELGVLAIYG